jgi:thiamine-phosphate pyrophosphorylase
MLDDNCPIDNMHDKLSKLPKKSGIIIRSRNELAPLKYTIKMARPWKYGHLLLLAGDIDYNCHGIHIREKEMIGGSVKSLSQRFLITTSCHSLPSMLKQQKRDFHGIIISPVFATNSHPNKKPLGIYVVRKMMHCARKPIIFLGGINDKTIRLLVLKTKGIRIAGISLWMK